MSPTSSTSARNPVASAMRKAGFVPSQRFWVRPEDLDKIKAIASRHTTEVTEIRQKVRQARVNARGRFGDDERAADPKEDREAAWEAAQRSQAQIDRDAAWELAERQREDEW